jgi:hypothetical protein
MIRAPPRFPLPFAAHRNFRAPPAPGITSPASRMVNQIDGHGVDAVHADQLRGLGLELRQLQDRDFARTVHHSGLYRNAV